MDAGKCRMDAEAGQIDMSRKIFLPDIYSNNKQMNGILNRKAFYNGAII